MSARHGLLAVLAFGVACTAAHAADQPLDPPGSSVWSIEPAAPTTRDFVRVRNLFTGCGGSLGLETEVDLPAHRIIVLGWGSDICHVVYDDINEAPVGYLPPGSYTVEFLECHGEFPPGEQCSKWNIPTLSFVVAEGGRPRQVIPAVAATGLIVLSGLLALLAGVALRRAS